MKKLEKLIRTYKIKERDTVTNGVSVFYTSKVEEFQENPYIKVQANSIRPSICRRIFLERDCRYYVVITRKGEINFIKSHEHSIKSKNQILQGSPKCFNGGISCIEGQIYLRCDEGLRKMFNSGVEVYDLLFETPQNCIVYIVDSTMVDNEYFLMSNKFIQKKAFYQNDEELSQDIIGKYTPDDHCKAIMNSIYSQVRIGSIDEESRFMALSFGQLMSCPFNLNTESSENVIQFDFSKIEVTRPNQQPFRSNRIPYENSEKLLTDFIGRLRYQKLTKEQNSKETNGAKNNEVPTHWDLNPREIVNFKTDVLDKEMREKITRSDPGKFKWTEISSDDENDNDEKLKAKTTIKEIAEVISISGQLLFEIKISCLAEFYTDDNKMITNIIYFLSIKDYILLISSTSKNFSEKPTLYTMLGQLKAEFSSFNVTREVTKAKTQMDRSNIRNKKNSTIIDVSLPESTKSISNRRHRTIITKYAKSREHAIIKTKHSIKDVNYNQKEQNEEKIEESNNEESKKSSNSNKVGEIKPSKLPISEERKHHLKGDKTHVGISVKKSSLESSDQQKDTVKRPLTIKRRSELEFTNKPKIFIKNENTRVSKDNKIIIKQRF